MKTKSKDSIGDRMKGYEAHETLRRSMKRLPICVPSTPSPVVWRGRSTRASRKP